MLLIILPQQNTKKEKFEKKRGNIFIELIEKCNFLEIDVFSIKKGQHNTSIQNSFTIMLHNINVSEVERDTSTQRVTQTEKNQGYYMQGDDKMDSNCNHPEEKKYSLKTRKLLLLIRYLLVRRYLLVKKWLLFRICLTGSRIGPH